MNQSTQIAKLLLEIKAVTLNPSQPYRYTSGLLSPIYCDNRLIISYPDKRRVVIEAFLNLIRDKNLSFDVVAGTATAGIPHAAWIADRLNKPMVYVRSKSKAHGKQNQIEGTLRAGQTTLVVEDLISTGSSAVNAAVALRDANATVTDCVAIFTYQLPEAHKAFADVGIRLHALADFATLIDVATQAGYINAQEKSQALAWNADPAKYR